MLKVHVQPCGVPYVKMALWITGSFRPSQGFLQFRASVSERSRCHEYYSLVPVIHSCTNSSHTVGPLSKAFKWLDILQDCSRVAIHPSILLSRCVPFSDSGRCTSVGGSAFGPDDVLSCLNNSQGPNCVKPGSTGPMVIVGVIMNAYSKQRLRWTPS